MWAGCGRAISIHVEMNVKMCCFDLDWSTVSVRSKREKCIEMDGEERVDYKG